MKLKNVNWELIIKVFLGSFTFAVFISLLVLLFTAGFRLGLSTANKEFEGYLTDLENQKASSILFTSPQPIPTPFPTRLPEKKEVKWGGPDLWTVVNAKRVTYGVNPLTQKDELCTIASIRLNELLNLGKLDGHEGFSNLPERRPDLKSIFEKYTIAEFLVSGADSPDEAVSLWDNTMSHKKLLTGGEYAYGCIYAQNGFGVAIAAYE